MPEEDFAAFLSRVRAGDEEAADELVRRFDSVIRREVRLRLTDPSVFRLVDDEDVCQSVLASFFRRAALGQYDLRDPAQLRQLLVSMARHKLAHAGRREHTQKRDAGRNKSDPVEDLSLPGGEATPSRVVAGREMLEQIRKRLNDEERRVAELRAVGHSWGEIAEQMGGTADGRRMQLTRALDRVSIELGLEDDHA
jgi:RNA polymerase sigma-70 factor (ECF subfamily)